MKKRELNVVAGDNLSFAGEPSKPHAARSIFARVVRECVWPHGRPIAILICSMAITAGTVGALPFLLQQVGDGIFVQKDRTLLFVLPLLVVFVMTLRAAADWATTVTEASLGTRVVAELRSRMFDTIAAADLAWIQRNHSGRFVSAFFYDAPNVNSAVVKVLTGLFKNGLSVVILLGAMLYMDWRLGSVVLIGAPLALLNLRHQKIRIRRSARRTMAVSGDLSSMLTQTLQGMRIVKAYGQEGREAQRLRETVSTIRKLLMKTIRSRATVGPIWDAVIGIGLAAAILYGGWQGINDRVTLGQFMGFMTAALLAFQPLKALAGIQATLSEGLLAAERVFGLIDHASHVTESPGAKRLRVASGAITFKKVNFSYEDGGPVLADFDLDIAAGQKLALVGPSGAGKSTVLNLILRFFDPLSGTVLIDGQDIRGATIASVRGASALLTQEPILFDDTIAGNIGYGSEGVSEAEIVAAAEAAAIHDFITRLPGGYETRVGEAGHRMSGGERQRIAFARAMLRNTPIVLLDEPTSALDAESERKIQAAMDRVLRDRTVIIIAHRLSTVKKADRICYMENGRILESGTHAELVARNGRYARMVETQLLGDEPRLAVAGA